MKTAVIRIRASDSIGRVAVGEVRAKMVGDWATHAMATHAWDGEIEYSPDWKAVTHAPSGRMVWDTLPALWAARAAETLAERVPTLTVAWGDEPTHEQINAVYGALLPLRRAYQDEKYRTTNTDYLDSRAEAVDWRDKARVDAMDGEDALMAHLRGCYAGIVTWRHLRAHGVNGWCAMPHRVAEDNRNRCEADMRYTGRRIQMRRRTRRDETLPLRWEQPTLDLGGAA